ncbi:MAG: SDR family NAD(P)-dependent oxidoreductase [Verrucomicrobiales bacterium]|nr:SDR family NAD(P)-dependent oxidoreductase [Verrucomicrobiales bacterium]
MNEQNKKIALVTGASSGIGAAAATLLSEKGYQVLATARSMDKLEKLRSNTIEPFFLDVTDGESIREAFDHLREKFGRLDVLVNNAGYGGFGVIESMPEEDARKQFDVNVFGAMEVTRAALPMMREQGSGKIVQLASVVSDISMPVGGWYAASKHAIQGLMDALRLEVEGFGIHVSMIKPGPIDSGFEEAAIEELKKSDPPAEYQPLIENFTEVFRKMYEDCPGPEVVMDALEKILDSDNPNASYADTLQSRAMIAAKGILPASVFDKALRSQLNAS